MGLFEESAAFLEERSKKFLVQGEVAPKVPKPTGEKFFCFFFFKKRSACFLTDGLGSDFRTAAAAARPGNDECPIVPRADFGREGAVSGGGAI